MPESVLENVRGENKNWAWWAGGLCVAAILLLTSTVWPGGKAVLRPGMETDSPGVLRSSALTYGDSPTIDRPQAAGVAGMGTMGLTKPLGGVMGGIAGNPAAPLSAIEVQAGPMIARSVSLTMVVKDVEAARAAVETVLAKHGGYAARLSVVTTAETSRRFEASLRIPAGELGSAMAEMQALGKVESETQSGEEVSAEHADLEARLKTARATEESFRAILRERHGTVADVMSVEEGIERVRGEIERMETQQGALEHRVEYAGVELAMAERMGVKADSAGMRVERAAESGMSNVRESLFGVGLWGIEYGPVTLVWVGLAAVPVVVWSLRRQRSVRL